MKSAHKSAYFALSVLLVACTAAPPLQSSNPVSGLGNVLNPANPSGPAASASKSPTAPSQRSLPNQSSIEQAQAKLQSDTSGDRLQLTVQIKAAGYQTQRLELERIKNLKAWVKGPGITGQINNLNGFIGVTAPAGQATTLDITQVPRGKHRIVTVQGYQEQASNQAPEVNGATLKAVYDSPPAPATEVVLNFNWRSTAEAEIIEALLAQAEQNPEVMTLLDNLDQTALNTLLDKVIYGNNPVGGPVYNVHPDRLNPESLADILVAASGAIPAYTVGNPIPVDWLDKMYDATLTVRNPDKVAFSNSDITIQITDPASAPIVISNGNDTVTIPKIVPGVWDAIVSIPGPNGGVSTRATITVAEDGTATLSAGASGADPIILPPIIQSVNTNAVNAGDEITLSGDGFDATTLANNIVKFGDTEAVVVSATATTIVVKVPPGVTGSSQVTVTSSGKTSNYIDVTVPVRLVKLDSLNGIAGNQVNITVTGYNPTLIDSIVRFNGVDVEPVRCSPTAATQNTICVIVPSDATTGPISVTPNIPQFPAPLTSPTYTIGLLPPDITDVSSQNNKMVITGVNFLTATQVTVFGITLAASDYTVINNTTIHVNKVPVTPTIGDVTVKNPDGTDLFTIDALYKNVINFIGPGTQSQSYYQTAVSDGFGGWIVPGDPVNEVKTIPTHTETGALTGFSSLHGVNVDDAHNIYITTLNHRVFKFNQAGVLQWQAGTGTAALNTTVQTTLAAATFGSPEDSASDRAGNLYVADTSNNAIRKITPTGQVITLARVHGPEGVEVSHKDGCLYVTSNKPDNNPTDVWVKKICNLADLPSELSPVGINPNNVAIPTSNVVNVAGGLSSGSAATGSSPASSALFDHLEGLGIDGDGNIYVADVDVQQIRKISADNTTVTVFKTFTDPLFTMHEIRVDLLGNIFLPAPLISGGGLPIKDLKDYAAATKNTANTLYKLGQDGSMTAIAGRNTWGQDEGNPLTAASFSDPRGVDIAPDGTLYIVDNGWGIRKIERYYPISNLPGVTP